MTYYRVSMLSRQRFLIVIVAVTSFMAQGVVEGWTFPRQQTKLFIPFDYPLNLPFYKIAILPETTDVLHELSVEFNIQRIRTHVGNATDSRAVRVKPLVDVDKNGGTLYLIRKPTDLKMLENISKGKQHYHLLVNITVSGQTKPKGSLKKTEIILELSGSMNTFCNYSLRSCFTNPDVKYTIPEESSEEEAFDYLMNPSFTTLCPNSTFTYKVTTGDEYVRIDKKTGALFLNSVIDAEITKSFGFKVNCFSSNGTYTMKGDVEVVDINDNSPTTQDGNISKSEIRYLKPGEKWVSFDVSAIDKDSKDVNDFAVRIEDDSLNLFKARNIKIYELMGTVRNTFFYADIVPQRPLSFMGEYYNFTVIIEDKSLIYTNDSITYKFSVINRTESEDLPFKDVYTLNVSKNAGKFSRLIQFTKNNYSKSFKFSLGAKLFDWLGITVYTGIVYIRNPQSMPTGIEQRRVIWSSKNGTYDESGSILLVITTQDTSSSNCSSDMWCSFYSKEDSCVNTCGNGSRNGHCVWRHGPLTYSGPTPDYSTCSSDLLVCPDGQCDELEHMVPTLCPQDCTRRVTGEATMNSNKQGIFDAVGPCSCLTTDGCKCVRDYPPPGELRRPKKFRFTTVAPFPGVNDTFIDDASFIEMVGETSTSKEVIAPLTGPILGESCDAACIVIASMVPFGLVMFIVVLILARKLRTKGLMKHKFVGSHISLSAVPSDYVEERSNSVQDSRNTPSETASFGKAAIDSKWEFPRNRLQFLCVLGEGEFGKVMKADAWNIGGNKGYTTVAVKMLKENGGTAERQDLFTEFLLLKEISHPNVVKLLGACTEKSGEFFLIVEYAEMGSLRSYLRKKRRHNSCCRYNDTCPMKQEAVGFFRDYYQFPCERSKYEPRHNYFHKEQLSFAWQIAKGMSYLSDLKLVHRDLATRNVLLAKQKVVKISDFGLSRDVYEGETYLKKSRGKVPIKWMAIESLEDQIYTSRSDVWSFGVVLWEIMMNGATPYPGVTPQRLYNLLKAGYRMTKPDYCPDEVYLLMRQCWRTLPRERPSFKEIVLKLDFLLQDTVEYMDFVPKYKAKLLTPEEILPSPNAESSTTVKYTSVLLEDDEDDISGGELNENIGLVNLFEQLGKDPSTSQ